MNWIMLPTLLIYVSVIWTLRQKIKQYLLMRMVRNKVLHGIKSLSTDILIEGYNVFYCFVLIPVFFVGVALFLNTPDYSYNWLYSIVALIASHTSL